MTMTNNPTLPTQPTMASTNHYPALYDICVIIALMGADAPKLTIPTDLFIKKCVKITFRAANDEEASPKVSKSLFQIPQAPSDAFRDKYKHLTTQTNASPSTSSPLTWRTSQISLSSIASLPNTLYGPLSPSFSGSHQLP
jgi:hypothetical protein